MCSGMQVLIVDDDETICELVCEALSDEGYDVVTAPHGKAALDLLQEAVPDVILLDMSMPTMDGWEFSRVYHATPGPHAPLIVLTAIPHSLSSVADVKADSFLAKPFDLDDLVELVHGYERRRLPGAPSSNFQPKYI